MRLIDADALAKKCCTGIEEFGTCEKCLEYYARKGCDRTCYLEYRGEDVRNAPTIDAIPVEWLRQKAEENSHYAEPYFAFAYVLHEWQQTKSIEELQAESEMRDWKLEQEEQDVGP